MGILAATVAAIAGVIITSYAVDRGNKPAGVTGARDTGFYKEPPEIRLLADRELPGVLVYENWITNGGSYEDRVEIVPGSMPPARLSPGNPLVFQLAAAGMPAWIDLSVFVGIESDGTPTGDPERIVCVPVTKGMPCSVEFTDDRNLLKVTVRPSIEGRFAALNLGWHRSVAADTASFGPGTPLEVSATWAFAISWTPEPDTPG